MFESTLLQRTAFILRKKHKQHYDEDSCFACTPTCSVRRNRKNKQAQPYIWSAQSFTCWFLTAVGSKPFFRRSWRNGCDERLSVRPELNESKVLLLLVHFNSCWQRLGEGLVGVGLHCNEIKWFEMNVNVWNEPWTLHFTPCNTHFRAGAKYVNAFFCLHFGPFCIFCWMLAFFCIFSVRVFPPCRFAFFLWGSFSLVGLHIFFGSFLHFLGLNGFVYVLCPETKLFSRHRRPRRIFFEPFWTALFFSGHSFSLCNLHFFCVFVFLHFRSFRSACLAAPGNWDLVDRLKNTEKKGACKIIFIFPFFFLLDLIWPLNVADWTRPDGTATLQCFGGEPLSQK